MKSKVKLNVEVHNKHSFLKNLIAQGIEIFSVDANDNYLKIIVSLDDYYTIIKKMKTVKKIEVIRYYGIYGFFFFIRKYIFIIIAFFFGILINIILSHLILDIEVECPNQEIVERVQNDLKDLNIYRFHLQLSYDKLQKLKKELLSREKEFVEWMEIDVHGTKYTIVVEEKKSLVQNDDCVFQNVVAKKNAIISKIYGTDGEVVKKKNDYVSKGEIIISGSIHNGEEVVSNRCAKGEVYGEVWYRVLFSYPKEETFFSKGTKYSIGLFLMMEQKQYYFHSKFPEFYLSPHPLVSSYIYPFHIGFGTFYEKFRKIKKYNLSNINDIAYQRGEIILKDQISSDITVLRKKILKKEIKDSRIIIEVFFAVEENITDYYKIG